MKSNLEFWWVPLLLTVLCLLTATCQPALAQDEPTIAKDSIVVDANDRNGGWIPWVYFTVNPPIHSASVISVEWREGKRPSRTLDCSLIELAGGWKKASCGNRDEAPVTFTGMANFSVQVRNELLGTNTTLFKGTVKVAKSMKDGSDKYYGNEDWRLPIGYIYLDKGNGGFGVALTNVGVPQAYLFSQGKQLDEAHCDRGANDILTECAFWTVQGTAERTFEGTKHILSQNPGEYEIKVLKAGRLARSVKFTVDENGSFDNGIATANKLGSNRVIVPVKVIGDQDGMWNRLAWKTDAFYGNPLTGFTAPP